MLRRAHGELPRVLDGAGHGAVQVEGSNEAASQAHSHRQGRKGWLLVSDPVASPACRVVRSTSTATAPGLRSGSIEAPACLQSTQNFIRCSIAYLALPLLPATSTMSSRSPPSTTSSVSFPRRANFPSPLSLRDPSHNRPSSDRSRSVNSHTSVGEYWRRFKQCAGELPSANQPDSRRPQSHACPVPPNEHITNVLAYRHELRLA